MKNKLFSSITVMAVMVLSLSSCSKEDPMENEQYIKQVYMVGAYKKVAQFDIPFSSEPQEAYVSVAIGGTLFPDHDVTVTLVPEKNAIKDYNAKYMLDNEPVKYQELNPNLYEMPSLSGTIKAGDVYARIPLSIFTDKLECDSLYALAFKIGGTSDYEINKKDSTLILNFHLINEYSGDDYQLSDAVLYKVKNILDVNNPEDAELEQSSVWGSVIPRKVKAVSEKAVRFMHQTSEENRSDFLSNAEYWANLKANGVVFERDGGADSNTFRVKSWVPKEEGGLDIIDGKATFDEEEGFTFWYDYMNGNVRYRMTGKLAKNDNKDTN